MDKNDLERRLEAAEKQNLGLLDEIKYLKEQLAKAQDEPEIPEKPDFELDEKFYYLNSFTDCVEDGCVVDIDDIDFNMFHTADYANEFRRKCLLIAMMLHCKWHLCRDFIPEWYENAHAKYIVYYSHMENKFKVDYNYMVEENDVFFDTKENAKKCADWLNAHWKEDGNG